MVVIIVAMVLVLGLVAIMILNNNNVYGLQQQESKIEIKKLTPWQWEKVRNDMNFTGLKMSEDVIEYNKILDGDYDGQKAVTSYSEYLLDKAEKLMDKAELDAWWNDIKMQDALNELDRLEQEMNRLID